MSNIEADGKPIGSLGHGEAIWHTDMSYKDECPTASTLYAVEVPPVGGNTNFANMYMAF
jgi:taurine dioxygenase